MPRVVEGVHYFTSVEIAREIGVSRQTMWRWRKEGKIPVGHRFRDQQVVFTEREVQTIREYANRIERIEDASHGQLQLFD